MLLITIKIDTFRKRTNKHVVYSQPLKFRQLLNAIGNLTHEKMQLFPPKQACTFIDKPHAVRPIFRFSTMHINTSALRHCTFDQYGADPGDRFCVMPFCAVFKCSHCLWETQTAIVSKFKKIYIYYDRSAMKMGGFRDIAVPEKNLNTIEIKCDENTISLRLNSL